MLATPPSHPTAKPPATQPSVIGNPLLPKQVDLTGFWPDMVAMQKAPTIAPAGFIALYSPTDWSIYRDKFGAEADAISKLRSSGQLEFARKLIAAGNSETHRGGLKRLLYVRAAAIAYRHRDGTPVAAEAIAAYQAIMDLTVPADVAALWSMADAMTRYATTPKPARLKFSNLAARANIQLCMLLLEAGQIDGAQKVVKMLGRHEVAIRHDDFVRPLAYRTRTLVSETVSMMVRLASQWQKVAQPPAVDGSGIDNTAVVELYLYARFIAHQPDLMNELLLRRGSSALGHLHNLLEQAKTDPQAMFSAAESLKRNAESLPEGVLKYRVLYAAWQYYDAFANNPATERERIKRTLAGIAKQGLIGDGAHGPPAIHPFAPPVPATQPGTTTAPATQPAPNPRLTPPHSRTGVRTAPVTPPPSPPVEKPDPTRDGTPEHPVG